MKAKEIELRICIDTDFFDGAKCIRIAQKKEGDASSALTLYLTIEQAKKMKDNLDRALTEEQFKSSAWDEIQVLAVKRVFSPI